VKNQNEKKPEKKGTGWKMTWTFFVYAAALLCFVGAGVFFGISAILSEEKDFSPVLQCAAGVLLLHLPFLFERFLKIAIPKFMKAVFYVFLVGSILCGTALAFFYTVPHWDDIMHFISGTLAGLFGYVLLRHIFRRCLRHCSRFALRCLSARCGKSTNTRRTGWRDSICSGS